MCMQGVLLGLVEQRIIVFIRILLCVGAFLRLAWRVCQASLRILFSIWRAYMRHLLGGYLWIVVLF